MWNIFKFSGSVTMYNCRVGSDQHSCFNTKSLVNVQQVSGLGTKVDYPS
jgi:hypothetical protein